MKKALLALSGALLFLAVVFLIREYADRAAAKPRYAVTAQSNDSVTSLRITYWGTEVTLRRGYGHGGSGGDEDRWVVAGDDFPADAAKLSRVLGHLLTLQTGEPVSRDDSGRTENLNLKEYGLDSASARFVEWTFADGRTLHVLLGKVSGIDYGSSYWKPRDEAVVYRTPGTFVFDVSSRTQDWKDTNLYVPHAPFGPTDIRSVAVTWRDSVNALHEYTLERDRDTNFVLRTAENTDRQPANKKAAAAVFTHAAQFKVDEFVPGVDSSATRAGLENPVMTIRVTLKSGTEHRIEAGNAVDGLFRYTRHPTHPAPVRVFGWRFEYFRKTGEDFL
jgi:hypothetical protein